MSLCLMYKFITAITFFYTLTVQILLIMPKLYLKFEINL